MKFAMLSAMLLAGLAGARLSAQDGSDVNQAIPIYFGQEISDTVDEQLKPLQVYSITLAQGQTLSVTASVPTARPWCVAIFAPTTRTLADLRRTTCTGLAPLATSGAKSANNSSLAFDYQVPIAGKYYIAVAAGAPSLNYKLQVTAHGTPIGVPNPPSAGCLNGRVDSITWSLQLIAAGLADEAVIGGARICTSCTVKQPLYPEIVNRLENALRSKVNVEACYDAGGNIFQIKLVQP